MKGRLPSRIAFAAGLVVGAACFVALVSLLDHTELADRLVLPLQRPDTDGSGDAIVVLGGAFREPCGLDVSSWHRTRVGIRLWEEGRAPRLVFTGGPSRGSPGVAPAERMAALAIRLGVPREAILLEPLAKDTRENAERSAQLLRPLGVRRVILVTDSIHMRRAEGCFRRAGFEVERVSVHGVCVTAGTIAMLERALHELGGWLYYRRMGWMLED